MADRTLVASAPQSRSADTDEYRPGVCNIGPAEIARRRRAGHVGLAVTLAALAVMLAVGAPPALRLLIAIPAALAAVGYLCLRPLAARDVGALAG